VTLLAELVRTSAQVAGTSSRLAKTALIAECLKRLDADEVEIALPDLSGDTRQGRLALGYATLQPALGSAFSSPVLTVHEVDAAFSQLKSAKGKGSPPAPRP
jgi:DNA ligase-1